MLKRLFGSKSQPKQHRKLDPNKIPNHVAIIMDGNGRWATSRGLPRNAGHQKGVQALKDICYACKDLRIKNLTVYAFSTENWDRPESEVSFLMDLFRKTIRKEFAELGKENVKFMVHGRREGLDSSLMAEFEELEKQTIQNDGLMLNVCFNYGGRAEIIDACKKIISQGIDPEKLDEEMFNQFLYTKGLPDVDLMIRTSGEQRLSNFLIYQSAYAEMVFSPVYWPGFSKDYLIEAIWEFQNRERRFGRINER